MNTKILEHAAGLKTVGDLCAVFDLYAMNNRAPLTLSEACSIVDREFNYRFASSLPEITEGNPNFIHLLKDRPSVAEVVMAVLTMQKVSVMTFFQMNYFDLAYVFVHLSVPPTLLPGKSAIAQPALTDCSN